MSAIERAPKAHGCGWLGREPQDETRPTVSISHRLPFGEPSISPRSLPTAAPAGRPADELVRRARQDEDDPYSDVPCTD
jgi:hypothetical protein